MSSLNAKCDTNIEKNSQIFGNFHFGTTQNLKIDLSCWHHSSLYSNQIENQFNYSVGIYRKFEAFIYSGIIVIKAEHPENVHQNMHLIACHIKTNKQ